LTARHLANDHAAYARNADVGAVVMMMVAIIAIVTVVMVMMTIIAIIPVVMVMMMVVVILGELNAARGLGLESGVVGD
jgi:hypothetical protein